MAYQVVSAALSVGDRVLYSGTWGRGSGTECEITGVGTNHGQRVYDNSLGHWGYERQYVLIIGEAGS